MYVHVSHRKGLSNSIRVYWLVNRAWDFEDSGYNPLIPITKGSTIWPCNTAQQSGFSFTAVHCMCILSWFNEAKRGQVSHHYHYCYCAGAGYRATSSNMALPALVRASDAMARIRWNQRAGKSRTKKMCCNKAALRGPKGKTPAKSDGWVCFLSSHSLVGTNLWFPGWGLVA